MATSRTGTSRWLKLRQRTLRQAQADGLTHCPGTDEHGPCGRLLDYTTPRLPGSAELDHIVPHAAGGQDTIDNTRVICRTCNLARNRKKPRPTTATAFPTSRAW